jgi:hypothetical protein
MSLYVYALYISDRNRKEKVRENEGIRVIYCSAFLIKEKITEVTLCKDERFEINEMKENGSGREGKLVYAHVNRIEIQNKDKIEKKKKIRKTSLDIHCSSLFTIE